MTLLVESGFSQSLDPAYTQTFGYGIVLPSFDGFPQFVKYDAAQFNYKNGKFMFPVGEETTMDLRAILPQGTTVGSFITKLEKERPQNLNSKTNEFMVWTIWCWHPEINGQPTDASKWPKTKTDIPLWAAPCAELMQSYDETVASRNTTGLDWSPEGSNLKFFIGSDLQSAVPGDKFYITFRVAYEYSVPGGQIEQKWNADLYIWEPRISTGGIGYVYSDPLAVGIVEIDAYEDFTGRFTDNGNGTVTDGKAKLMWMKTPPDQAMYWDNAKAYTDSLSLAGYTDWRLPTLKELKEMMKISKIKDAPYECKWLNENGFSNVLPKAYWCGDPFIRNGAESGKNVVDFENKTLDGKETNYEFRCWAVRNIN